MKNSTLTNTIEMTNISDAEYYTLVDAMAKLKTPEELDTFAETVLAKMENTDPSFKSLLNTYGMLKGIRKEKNSEAI